MDRAALKQGGRYNWIGQPERLIYMGTKHYPGDRRTWFQFSLVGDDPEACWCEVLESDLSGFEETTQPTASPGGAVSAGDPHLWGRAEAACRDMHGTDWDTMYSGDQESNIRAWIAGYTAATQEKGATSRSA